VADSLITPAVVTRPMKPAVSVRPAKVLAVNHRSPAAEAI
jgi:hypothetical protein